MKKFLYRTFAAAIILISVVTPNAFAQTDFKKIEGDEIKNNPTLQDFS
jgi:hypothetical protein